MIESSLAERMERLERENRRLADRCRRTWGALAVAALFVAVLMAVGGARPADDRKTVEAERFVLRDRDEKIRAELVAENGEVRQSFFDGQGRRRLELGVTDQDWVGLTITDTNDRTCLLLHLDPGGAAELIGYGRDDDKPRFSLSVETDGLPILAFTDKDGKQRFGVAADADGATTLTLWDRDGKVQFHAPQP